MERTWTDEQFDEMSWHDNHVHAMRIVEGKDGAGGLILDLDYIFEWMCDAPQFQFSIVPALLTFRDVTDLRISLDYAGASAALGPFAIHAIERRTEQRQHYVARLWRILINWPVGEISFEATGFVQRSRGAPQLTDRQSLKPNERGVGA
jgi:hypothetical protein